jgi:hypothetical protein
MAFRVLPTERAAAEVYLGFGSERPSLLWIGKEKRYETGKISAVQVYACGRDGAVEQPDS